MTAAHMRPMAVHGTMVVHESAAPRVSGAARMCEPEEPAARTPAPAAVHTQEPAEAVRMSAVHMTPVVVHGTRVVHESAVPRVSGAARMCEPEAEEPPARTPAPAAV